MAEREHFTNFRTTMFGTGIAFIATAFGAQISGWMHWITIGISYGVGLALLLTATVLIAQSLFSGQSAHLDISTPQASGMIPGIPTLSALLGQNPSVDFNVKKFLALAHYSPVTAEVEKTIKIVAQQNFPNDREAFYARFIGVGIVAYQHDQTWLMIFGSQLKAMAELGSLGLIPIANLKKYYDKAVLDYPKAYKDYSFEQWVAFMETRMLIVTYPTKMAELSFNGQDFLKYLAHVGRNPDGRPN